MLPEDVLDAPKATRGNGSLVSAFGDLGGGVGANAVLGSDAEHGCCCERARKPCEKAGHGHCCEDGEECDGESDEGCRC